MKLLKRTTEGFLFALPAWERELLLAVFRLYPRIPAGRQPLSKSPKIADPEANQRLLDEALAEQRTENKKHLLALLDDPKRFWQTETGWQLSLSGPDIEWVLQVLNDVRVGSWIVLGCPETRPEISSWTEADAAHLLTLEIADRFQMDLLLAVGGQNEIEEG